MSASGEGNNELAAARTVEPPEDLDGSSTALTPALPPDIATDLQRQIKANQALVGALREELRQGRLAPSPSSTVGHRSPSVVSLRGQKDALLFPGVSALPDDSISVFAQESSFQEPSAQGASFRCPSSVDLDVEPYLSQPQVDTHTSWSAENVSYVSDLLQLPKGKDDSASFRNMNEQLLSAEAVARTTSSLPPSHSVSHWPRETNIKIRGSENVKVLKQHKDSLQAHHKGMVGSEIFSTARHRIFPSSSYRIHDHVVKPTPQVLDADHDLLGPAEASVTIKASEFKAIESLVRSSMKCSVIH